MTNKIITREQINRAYDPRPGATEAWYMVHKYAELVLAEHGIIRRINEAHRYSNPRFEVIGKLPETRREYLALAASL